MSERAALDVSLLPTFAFGHRSMLWWATLGLIAIEGTVFALACAAYLYLRWRVPEWPPGLAAPGLFWGTATTIVLVVSMVPNELTKRAAERLDVPGVRVWLAVSLIFAAAFNVCRFYEFTALNCRWDTNAYGSAVWTLLGLHTTHIVTDFADSIVLAVLIFRGHTNGKRLVDVSENSFYWYFVVVAWLPIYGLIYWAPRIL
jgi:heme/copper-type cytochrome/quinol oxidase subunit 3